MSHPVDSRMKRMYWVCESLLLIESCPACSAHRCFLTCANSTPSSLTQPSLGYAAIRLHLALTPTSLSFRPVRRKGYALLVHPAVAGTGTGGSRSQSSAGSELLMMPMLMNLMPVFMPTRSTPSPAAVHGLVIIADKISSFCIVCTLTDPTTRVSIEGKRVLVKMWNN